MGSHLFEILQGYFSRYGYWTVGVVLLLENAGIPVPGETVLLVAGFLSYSQHELRLPYIILMGVCAATLGDNLGYTIGYYGGRPLLERYKRFFHVSTQHIERGERLFQQHGTVTVFFARFVFGMRIITGPLAGVLRMDWKKFALFNFLGAVLWVSVIASVGYLFGQHWERLLRFVKVADAVIAIIVAVVVFFFIRHQRSRT
jgi:membrane-associated protein